MEVNVKSDIFENLKKAITGYDSELAEFLVKEVVKNKMDLNRAFDIISEAMKQVGDRFGKGEIFLPELVGASAAMLKAMPIIQNELEKAGIKKKSLGNVVVGTVYGDIHTIGKTMVATLLFAAGFTVYDLGVNIKPEEFVNAVKKYNADILGMSALMTMTAPEQKKTIDILIKEGVREKVKVMVGGAAINQEFAESIGADDYDPTAPGAVELAKRLIGK